MENLQKKITGYWFDLKSVMEDNVRLFEFFDFSKQNLDLLIEKLYTAVEWGVIEYKTNILASVFNIIESLKYDTASLNMLYNTSANLESLTYAILLQRLIAKRALKLRLKTGEKEEQSNIPKTSISDIGNIIKEINILIAKDQSLKSDKNIQNILIQISKYKTENESMKKLINNIPKDKLENFKSNYSQSINAILLSIINNYNNFTKEKSGEIIDKHSSPFEQYDLTIISELLKKQGEEVAAVKSTIDYAASEGFGIREIIMTVNSREKKIKELLAEEKKKLFNISLSEQSSRELSRNFALEIIENLKRELENL